MNVSLTGSASTQAPLTPGPSTPTANPAPAHIAASAKDTVKLSQAGQVHALKQQGQSASQIQSSLGISAATVNAYLGIVDTKALAAAAAVPAAKR